MPSPTTRVNDVMESIIVCNEVIANNGDLSNKIPSNGVRFAVI